MIVNTDAGAIELGATEASPTVGILDFSERVTDDFGVTTVVERGFARRLSVRMLLPYASVDALQQRLAVLRATPALWVADERFACLSVEGFYNDFAIDLNTPPVSFCTLTVEGLPQAQPPADIGGEPAADGQASSFLLIDPIAIGDGALVASSVPETDHPAWAGGVAYVVGARVIRGHRIWEALIANTDDDPSALSGKWLDVGPTNRFAMFDQALGTATKRSGSIVVTVAGAIDAVALLDVVGATVRVQALGYDHTLDVAQAALLFLDMPAVSETTITITITGAGQVSVGTLLVGRLGRLGTTERSPTAAITDFSRKDTDDFGETTVVERGWAKKIDANALIRTDAIDQVFYRVAAVRARPALWIAQAGTDALTVYGFFRDFSISVGENVSKLAISIEGLSRATPAGVSVKDQLNAIGKDVDDLADLIDDIAGDVEAVAEALKLSQQNTPAVVADGSLTPDKKPLIAKELAFFTDRRKELTDRATPLRVSTAQMDADFAAFQTYVTGLAGWADPNATTPVDPAIYTNLRTSLFASIALLESAISGRIAQGSKVAEELVPGNSTIQIVGDQVTRSGTETGYQVVYSKRSTKGATLIKARVPADSALPVVIGRSSLAGGGTPSMASISAGFIVYRDGQNARRVGVIINGAQVSDWNNGETFPGDVWLALNYSEDATAGRVIHQVGGSAAPNSALLTTSPGDQCVFKALLVGGGAIDNIIFNSTDKVPYTVVVDGPPANATAGPNVIDPNEQREFGQVQAVSDGYFKFGPGGQKFITPGDGTSYNDYKGEDFFGVAVDFRNDVADGDALVAFEFFANGGTVFRSVKVRDRRGTVSTPIGTTRWRAFISAADVKSGSIEIGKWSIIPKQQSDLSAEEVRAIVSNDGVNGLYAGFGVFEDANAPRYTDAHGTFPLIDVDNGGVPFAPWTQKIIYQGEIVRPTPADAREAYSTLSGAKYIHLVTPRTVEMRPDKWTNFYPNAGTPDPYDHTSQIETARSAHLPNMPTPIPMPAAAPGLVSGLVKLRLWTRKGDAAPALLFEDPIFDSADAGARGGRSVILDVPAGHDAFYLEAHGAIAAVNQAFLALGTPELTLRKLRQTDNQVAIDVVTKPIETPASALDQPPSYYVDLRHPADPAQLLGEVREMKQANIIGLHDSDTTRIEVATTMARDANVGLYKVDQRVAYAGVTYTRSWRVGPGGTDGSSWDKQINPAEPWTFYGWSRGFSNIARPYVDRGNLLLTEATPATRGNIETALGGAASAATVPGAGPFLFAPTFAAGAPAEASKLAGIQAGATVGADFSQNLLNKPFALQPENIFASGYLKATGIYHTDGGRNLNTYFPEDINSNRTEGRTAAAATSVVNAGPFLFAPNFAAAAPAEAAKLGGMETGSDVTLNNFPALEDIDPIVIKVYRSTGQRLPNQFPVVRKARLMVGGVDRSNMAQWSISPNEAVTAAIDTTSASIARGTITVTDVLTSTVVVVTALYGGRQVRRDFRVTVQLVDPPPATAPNTFSYSDLVYPFADNPARLTPWLPILVTGSGQIFLSAGVSCDVTFYGTVTNNFTFTRAALDILYSTSSDGSNPISLGRYPNTIQASAWNYYDGNAQQQNSGTVSASITAATLSPGSTIYVALAFDWFAASAERSPVNSLSGFFYGQPG